MVWGQCHTLEMALEEVAIIVGQLLPGAACAQMAAQRRHDERLNLCSGNAADRSAWLGLPPQHGLRDVIAVARASLVLMRLPRLSKRRPLRMAGASRSRQRRATAWAPSLACTAANRARSTIGACSPPWTSPGRTPP